MTENELEELIENYRSENGRIDLLRFLKKNMIQELESFEVSNDRQRHDLNILIRDLEEGLDRVESEKLSGFDPEKV